MFSGCQTLIGGSVVLDQDVDLFLSNIDLQEHERRLRKISYTAVSGISIGLRRFLSDNCAVGERARASN